MSLKNIFNHEAPKKLNVGPTQSIYNTIKQKQAQKSNRSTSRGSMDPAVRGSINMAKVFKPQNSNTVMQRKYQQK